MQLTLKETLLKGIQAHKAGKQEEAYNYFTAILKVHPKHPDANHNIGVLAVGLGKVKEALPFFKTALEANPRITQFWLSYIDALIKLNRVADAKTVFDEVKSKGLKGDGFELIEKRLLSSDLKNINMHEPPQDLLNPLKELYRQKKLRQVFKETEILTKQYTKSLTLWNLMGISAAQIGKPEEAVIAFQNAINIKPDYFKALNNMGNALKDQGKLDEAIEAYNKALSIKPDYAQAYYNMGITLKDQSNLDKAIEAYNKALSIKPDFAEAYNNMGNALKKQGRLNEAIEAFNKALSIKPDFAEAYKNMGNVLQGVIFKKPNKGIQNIISSLLDKKLYVRPTDIDVATISLLKFEPSLQKHLKLVRSGELIHNPLDIISDLDELPLLRKLMSICPLQDLELETLLKQLRASLLENISSLKKTSPELLRFQSALALQCFTNEYIYSQSKNEEIAINDLENKIKELLSNNEQPSPLAILILASYKALHNYEWCQSLIVTNQIQDVFTRQIEEPNHEEKLKLSLPTLAEISNKVSSNVREQYEERPYPRWVNLGLKLKSTPISKVVKELKLRLHCEKINSVKNPNILIAGCGTGQHSISTAARNKSSKVLAIDLSLSSLAYAKRKTKELTINNIEYMQADILDLSQLNIQFDIIESVGVLHHMDNPMKGWKVLTDCLKSGGLMRIGLYSELARQNIVKIIKEINQTGIGSSNTEMRSFRETIIRSDKEHHRQVLKFPDFYSLSELRDLLFHVQEHRFTIPLIKKHLNNLGLKFCGFESSEIVSHFKETNKYNEDSYDLDKWHLYEEANPNAFALMYQFWCQKDIQS